MEFAAFVTARQSTLLRFATVLCEDASLAQDLVQEALLRAHARWGRISAMAAPEAYVKKMIVNGHLSFRRKFSRIRLVDEVEPAAAPGDHAQRTADRAMLAAELAKLPRRQRTVLVLRYYEGLSDREVAEVLSCSPGTVRGYASRALATLRIDLTGSDTDAERDIDRPRKGGMA